MFRPQIEISASPPPPYVVGQEVNFTATVTKQNAAVSKIVWNFDGSGVAQGTRAQRRLPL